jgi:hypothetical protein
VNGPTVPELPPPAFQRSSVPAFPREAIEFAGEHICLRPRDREFGFDVGRRKLPVRLALRTNSARAIGAGAGCSLKSHLTLDVAYGFVDLGQLRTDSSLSFSGITIPVTPSKTGDAGAHQVMIGLRYEF